MTEPTLQDPGLVDPRETGAKPPYAQRKIAHPGAEGDMGVAPDHGESSYAGSGRLRGRVALITGGDSGIGRAVAIAYARALARVAISHLPEEERDGRETLRWLEQAGVEAVALPGDLCDEGYCRGLVDETHRRLGGLDILVNNAAFQMAHEDLGDFTSAEFDRTFKTNIYAMFWLCRAALPRMPAGAAIINVASIQAYDPSANLLPYAATKAAIVNFTKGLAPIAMKRGVRVNAVAPGPVWTPLIPATMPAEKVRTFGEHTAFGRAAQPVEMAPMFVFLASNEARYATGEVFAMTGGQSPQ